MHTKPDLRVLFNVKIYRSGSVIVTVIRLKFYSVNTIEDIMANYIDGFVFPIARDRLNEYKQLAEAVAEIWKEHGAIDYYEYVGDDMKLEGTRSFTDVIAASENETIVLGWIVFDSRETRDLVNQKVAADPRMVDLVDISDSGFNAQRMAYGGFKSLVRNCDGNAV